MSVSILGDIFPESVSGFSRHSKTSYNSKNSRKGGNSRYYFFILLFVFGLGLLSTRLFSLTLIEGKRYRQLSSENRIREMVITAPRGIIYDRNDKPLVRNIPLISDPKSTTREYIYGPVLASVLGYLGEVGPEELDIIPPLKSPGSDVYKMRDIVGKMGIEKIYDAYLRGVDGREMFEVDAANQYIRTLGRVDPRVGASLNLTLDLDLSKKAWELLKDKKGAVVVTEPESGAVLVLYSSPSFDPNNILKGNSLSEIFDNPDRPLFNRAISGQYPPGSTFKIITAIAGLSTGSITANTTIEDTGVITVGDYSYSNWFFTQYGKTEGSVDLVKALRRSNDIYFYKVGEKIGIEKLAFWGKQFGLGKKLGIELAGEAEGLMSDPVWQKKVKKEQWYLGNTYHTAIGQGDILATPLQVNAWTNVIANGGFLCRPFLNAKSKKSCLDLNLEPSHIETVSRGMTEACSAGGTGWPLFNFMVDNPYLKIDGVNFLEGPIASGSARPKVSIPVGCKTGTAEFGDPDNKTHAWFTAFAPSSKPQLAVTVLVEEGGEGSSVAGPIVRDILKAWFER